MMASMLYGPDQSLPAMITPGTWTELTRFAGARGIPADAIKQFKPGLVMIFLTLAEIERLGVGGAGVDEHYFLKGQAAQRPMIFLEQPMDQIRFLADIGKGNEDEMVSYILKDIGKLPKLLPEMKAAWRTGDAKRLYQTALAPLKKEFPGLYHTIMVQRNLDWMPQIQAMFDTPEIEFVLVGAAHLAGDQGLIQLLRQQGYQVINQ